MPNRHVGQLIRLYDRIGGAFHPARDAKRMQEMAHQGSFPSPKIAMQSDEGVAERRRLRQGVCKRLCCRFVRPKQAQWQSFYNRRVNTHNAQASPTPPSPPLLGLLQAWAQELGFSQIGISGVDLSSAEPGLLAWLEHGFHGEMDYMERHGLKRARPAQLLAGTLSVITARMDYLPSQTPKDWQALEFAGLSKFDQGTVSIYARGRDYHKVVRQRLQQLAERLSQHIGPLGHRAFTDSAPVLEAELAVRSGIGWRGKHTLVLHREAGSMFFLGEIFIDMVLEPTPPVTDHCGSCNACMAVCPTQAIVAPYQLDARRCISYLTIEYAGSIAMELRPLMGNRIYGCDDCQLACPWNKYAQRSNLKDFDSREGLTGAALTRLLDWSEEEFLRYTEGSPIRRIGHAQWLRNVSIALGNAMRTSSLEKPQWRSALLRRVDHPSAIVREHVAWALAQEPEAA